LVTLAKLPTERTAWLAHRHHEYSITMFAGLLHENITMVERINFQKVEVIVIYFLCNPSVTKQRDASDTTQNMLH